MEPFTIGEQKNTQIVYDLQVLATLIGNHLTSEPTASPVLKLRTNVDYQFW